jgi:putative heme transporter
VPRTREASVKRTEIHIPVATIVKVLVTSLIVWAALQLVPEILLCVLAVLVAVTLSPLVARVERFGLSKAASVALVGIAIVALAVAFVFLVLPALTAQIETLVQNYRLYRGRVDRQLSSDYPVLRSITLQVLDLPSSPEIAASLKRPLAWGRVAVLAMTASVLGIVMVLYLLLDGKRTYAWLLAYVPRKHRKRMAQTVPEVSQVVIAYVQGQLLTSALCSVYAFAVLSILKVPAALALSLLAAICDVIPVIGLIVSTVPAALLALTVSPLAAGAVLLLYALYHLFENYVIVPKVYGMKLRLSGLAVLITLIVGGKLYGIAGAVLALPVVAAYPIVERIWLQKYLSDEVLTDHSALEAAHQNGKSERTVEKVLRGEGHSLPTTTPG